MGNAMARMLVIDNYDSFTYNLVQMFRRYPLELQVVRADRISCAEAEQIDPDYLLISPGPRDPDHAGISKPLIESFYAKIPVLGVCLGMQCINEVFGGRTVRAPVPWHGKTSLVTHSASGIFAGIPSPFTVARYHSLLAEVAPETRELEITARSEQGLVMALAHRKYPLFGVQFHPESFLTEWGDVMIANFLNHGPMTGCRPLPDRFSGAWSSGLESEAHRAAMETGP